MDKHEFVAFNTDMTDERIAEIAKKKNISFNDAHHAALDCAYNVTADNYTIEHLFDEYQDNGKELQEWFDSYVVDFVDEALRCGDITQ